VNVLHLSPESGERYEGSGDGWPTGAAAPPRRNPIFIFLFFFSYPYILLSALVYQLRNHKIEPQLTRSTKKHNTKKTNKKDYLFFLFLNRDGVAILVLWRCTASAVMSSSPLLCWLRFGNRVCVMIRTIVVRLCRWRLCYWSPGCWIFVYCVWKSQVLKDLKLDLGYWLRFCVFVLWYCRIFVNFSVPFLCAAGTGFIVRGLWLGFVPISRKNWIWIVINWSGVWFCSCKRVCRWGSRRVTAPVFSDLDEA